MFQVFEKGVGPTCDGIQFTSKVVTHKNPGT